MPLLKIKNEGFELEVELGQTLVSIEEEHSTPLLFGCTEANCGMCKILVIDNPDGLSQMDEKERVFLESIDASPDERLGCQCRVIGDVTIEIADFGTDSIFG